MPTLSRYRDASGRADVMRNHLVSGELGSASNHALLLQDLVRRGVCRELTLRFNENSEEVISRIRVFQRDFPDPHTYTNDASNRTQGKAYQNTRPGAQF